MSAELAAFCDLAAFACGLLAIVGFAAIAVVFALYCLEEWMQR